MALLSKNTSPDGFQIEVLFLCPWFPHPNPCNSTPEAAPYIIIHMDNPQQVLIFITYIGL